MTYPRPGRFHFWLTRQLLPATSGIFSAKIQKWWQKLINFQKTNSQKVCLDTLNGVLIFLPNFLPDVHNPSRNFHCSKSFVPLLANIWAGGFQFWWTSKFSSRNPDFFRQKYENKIITPTGQIVFAYSPNVMTKTYTFFVKIFSPIILLDTLNSHLTTLPYNNLQKCKNFTLMIQN